MKEIRLTQGEVALVDAEDFEFLSQWKWHYHQEGKRAYALRSVYVEGKVRRIGLHRVVMRLEQGDKEYVDHIDGNGLNNRKKNLRIATHTQNLCNRGKQSNNTSGYKGVSWHKVSKKWSAQVQSNGKRHHLGVYKSLRQAVLVYNEAALRYHGNFACLNELPND